MVTPYILFSSEMRRTITDQNKNRSFGDISRIVGDKVQRLIPPPLMLFFSLFFFPLLLSAPPPPLPLLPLHSPCPHLKRAKSRPRSGYQIFSSQVWVRVKSEMPAGASFAELSREVGNQVRIPTSPSFTTSPGLPAF